MYRQGSYPAVHLEGAFIPRELLGRASAVGRETLWTFDNGATRLERSTHDNRWHVYWVLRERGLTLDGPEPRSFVPPVPVKAMLDEVCQTLSVGVELITASLDQPVCYHNSRFGQSFWVLTVCRILHTLYTGTVQSKRAGVIWAKDVVDPRWVPLIDAAWEERKGVRFGRKVRQSAARGRLAETIAFAEYAVELSRFGT